MAKSPRKSSVMVRLSARMTWDRVKIRTASNKEEEDGTLVVSTSSIWFVHNLIAVLDEPAVDLIRDLLDDSPSS